MIQRAWVARNFVSEFANWSILKESFILPIYLHSWLLFGRTLNLEYTCRKQILLLWRTMASSATHLGVWAPRMQFCLYTDVYLSPERNTFWLHIQWHYELHSAMLFCLDSAAILWIAGNSRMFFAIKSCSTPSDRLHSKKRLFRKNTFRAPLSCKKLFVNLSGQMKTYHSSFTVMFQSLNFPNEMVHLTCCLLKEIETSSG